MSIICENTNFFDNLQCEIGLSILRSLSVQLEVANFANNIAKKITIYHAIYNTSKDDCDNVSPKGLGVVCFMGA